LAFAVTDTASKLIDVMMKNNIISQYMQAHFTSLITCLKSGVPTVRNKQAGHGQGTQPQHVPDYLASYVLHLTAANIVMLVEADKALP
jgi:hypothetical protein